MTEKFEKRRRDGVTQVFLTADRWEESVNEEEKSPKERYRTNGGGFQGTRGAF